MNTRITIPAKYTNLVNKLSEEINKNSEFVRNSYGMVRWIHSPKVEGMIKTIHELDCNTHAKCTLAHIIKEGRYTFIKEGDMFN